MIAVVPWEFSGNAVQKIPNHFKNNTQNELVCIVRKVET